MCSQRTLDDIFAGKPDDLLLAFDDILVAVMDWEPNHVSAAKHAVVFTNKRAWLIVKPMSKQLDVAFYTDTPLAHPRIHKSSNMKTGGQTKETKSPKLGKHRHQIRLQGPGEIDQEVISLLRKGYDYGMR